jgi:hypothetical protein
MRNEKESSNLFSARPVEGQESATEAVRLTTNGLDPYLLPNVNPLYAKIEI